MEVTEVAKKIENKISQLEEARNQILDRAQEKAQAISEYDKALAKTILKLKSGLITEWDGINCSSLPATLIVPVSKGICYQEAFDKEANEAGYKSCLTIIEAIKAELNGLQSINKHLE